MRWGLEAAAARALKALQRANYHSNLAGEFTAEIQDLVSELGSPSCNPHPKAPHGFLRDASHSEDRYVCECEAWDPYEAGYNEGYNSAYNKFHKEENE